MTSEELTEEILTAAGSASESGNANTDNAAAKASAAEGKLWFANVYPERRNFMDIRHLLTT